MAEYEERPKALYVRENDARPESEMEGEQCIEPSKACTVQDGSSRSGCALGAVKRNRCEHSAFWTASGDGSRVFFTDESRVDEGCDSASSGEPDLYEYDLEAPEGERLSDVSLSAKPEPGVHADVQGVVGTSEDGSYVYFVADGMLAEGDRSKETAIGNMKPTSRAICTFAMPV